jgi:ABC-type nitrate/sulfonate/bicarbonate transport system ATPase subunit
MGLCGNVVAMSEDLLVVEKLNKRFGAQIVIENLSFSVKRGARVTVFAPSSAGKTTLIHILAGLDRDYEGSFTLSAGHPVTIFQEPRLFPYMTVEENIFLPARIRGIPIAPGLRPQDPARTAYERWLDVCGLSGYAQHYPYQLSGGMKQKVALIRGYLTGPDFVMMDEPFKSIDLASKQAIIRHILDTYPKATILFVTHAVEEVPLLTDSLLLFKTNRLAEYRPFRIHDVHRVVHDQTDREVPTLGEDTDFMEAIYG